MNFLLSMASGFATGLGLILAALVMRLLFHVGICG